MIPDTFASLLRSAGVATLSVVANDGSIQSSLVWPDFDGEFIKINTLTGSAKERSITRQRRATLLMYDPDNSDAYLSLRCELHKITRDGAIDHLNALTQRNLGLPTWYGAVEPQDAEQEQRRVIVYLKPVRVYHTG